MRPTQALRNRLRNSRAYPVWQQFREPGQVRAFEELVRGIPVGAGSYGPEQLRKSLMQLRAQRAEIGAEERPRVVAFGTCNWEDKGLWPAFDATSEFALFNFQKQGVAGEPAKRRKELARRFMEFIDAQPATPHVAYFYSNAIHLDSGLITEVRKRGIWTVLMSLDDKQQLSNAPHDGMPGAQLANAKAADVYWTTWRTGTDWLSAHDVNAWYAPEAADPDLFHPVEVKKDIDVLWLGRVYGRRTQAIEYLRSMGLSVEAYGPGLPGGAVEFERMIELFSRARVVLGMGGVGHTEAFKHLKGRDFEVPMCGAVYLTSFNPELTDHFAIGSEILCYSSPVECADVCQWILRRPNLAAKIGKAARERCLRDHTWKARVQQLFSHFRAEPRPKAATQR